MKRKNFLLMSFLIAFAVAGCSTPPGDFCLSASNITMKDKTAIYIVDNDIELARKIASHNMMYYESCG